MRNFCNKNNDEADKYVWKPFIPSYWPLEYDQTKGLPSYLETIQSVEYLDFDYFTPLPVIAKQWQKLHTCNISDAASTYTELPPEIYQYSNLKIFRVYQPDLQRFDDDMRQLKNLKELILRGHDFEELPAQLGQLKELQSLVINGRRKMKLSAILGALPNLKLLRLNFFRPGTMKKHFVALPTLTKG